MLFWVYFCVILGAVCVICWVHFSVILGILVCYSGCMQSVLFEQVPTYMYVRMTSVHVPTYSAYHFEYLHILCVPFGYRQDLQYIVGPSRNVDASICAHFRVF